MADPSRGIEEQYIVRILDPALQARMQQTMAAGTSEEDMPDCGIYFEGEGGTGRETRELGVSGEGE